MMPVEKEPISLSDIVQKGSVVFADSSALIGDDKGFFRILFEKGYNISPEELEPYVPDFVSAGNVLSNTNLYVTTEAIKELARGSTVLSEMQKYNNEKLRRTENSGYKVGRKRYETKKLVCDVSFIYVQNIRRARCREFRPSETEIYSTLSSIVEEISSLNRIKRDNRQAYRSTWRARVRAEPRFDDLKTDEKIVAAALYWSLVKKEGSNIVTRDGDIVKIFRASVFSFIEAGMSSGFYRSVADAIMKNPPDIYVTYLDENMNRTPMYCLSDNILNQRPGKIYAPITRRSQPLLSERFKVLESSGLCSYLY